MAKNVNTKDAAEQKLENIENVLSRTEQFIENNQKIIIYILGGIAILVLGFIGYKKLVVAPKENDAKRDMFMAEQYFEKDSFNLALNGDGNNFGFVDIIDNYGITKSANLAKYYAGICYRELDQFEDAIDMMKSFSTKDKMLLPLKNGNIGDAYVQLNDLESALPYYVKAATKVDNPFTAPYYLMKAGQVYEEQKNFAKALEFYNRIKKEYPTSAEGRFVEKYIARVSVISQE